MAFNKLSSIATFFTVFDLLLQPFDLLLHPPHEFNISSRILARLLQGDSVRLGYRPIPKGKELRGKKVYGFCRPNGAEDQFNTPEEFFDKWLIRFFKVVNGSLPKLQEKR